MSLRWNLFKFDAAAAFAVFGSRDEVLRKALCAKVRQRAEDSVKAQWMTRAEAEASVKEVEEVIARAIRNGFPFPELEGESDAHVVAMKLIVRSAPDVQEIEFTWDWKHGAWYAMHDSFRPLLTGAAAQALDWLVHGRPLLGRSFETGWSFYSHLELEYVRLLRDGIAGLLQRDRSLAKPAGDRVFVDELLNWLTQVVDVERDLWVYAD